MTGLDDRKEAFEAKFKYDEEIQFRVNARTSKIFGLWAAGELGLEGEETASYAKMVVEADLEEPGFQDVLRKVTADFVDKGIKISEHRMQVELEKAQTIAQAEVMEEKAS